MDLQQEASYFYEFVYQEEQIETPFDDWLPEFISHLEKVIKGEATPSSVLVTAMQIAHTRASTMPTPAHQDENLQCHDEELEETSS
jgi:hypothetical protein